MMQAPTMPVARIIADYCNRNSRIPDGITGGNQFTHVGRKADRSGSH
jgi:hypothetical protein